MNKMREVKYNKEIKISSETYLLLTRYTEGLQATYDDAIRHMLHQEYRHKDLVNRIRNRLVKVERGLRSVIVDEMPEEK